jgi:hypothetical protein
MSGRGEARFPPESWEDLVAYDDAECLEGYLDYAEGDPEPGANRSPSYRWGWITAKEDRTGVASYFYWLRREYIRETGLLQTKH